MATKKTSTSKKNTKSTKPSGSSSSKPTVYTTEKGNTMYRQGASGATVDLVGNYLVNNGYMDSYSGSYDGNMVNALAAAKDDLRGEGDWHGKTFGDATINAILKRNQEAADAAAREKESEFASYLQGMEDRFAQIQQASDARYEQMYSAMAGQQAQQQSAIRANTDQIVQNINATRGDYEDAYEESLRRAYINREMQKNQMGDYLATMGYSGGLAESTLTGIHTNYEENSRTAEKELSAANQQLDRLVAEAQATGNSDLVAANNEYYNNYLAALGNQQQMDYQIAADRENALADLRDYQMQQEQNKLAQQKYQDDRNDYTKSLERQQAEQDFQTFLNTFSKKYNKRETYENWINNLKAMSDPYGYNAQKIAYLQQYINQTFGKSKSVASNRGTNPSDPGIGGDGTYSTASLTPIESGTLTDARNILSKQGAQAAVSYLQKQNVSDSGMMVILRQLGLA